MPEYRIDELARVAGTTVRNVRAYQDKGLLPPPRREGRVGWYGDAHLARLRVLIDLLGRGYSQANIAEMLAASDKRQAVGELILAAHAEPILSGPWTDEEEVSLPIADLLERFGAPTAATIQRAIALGIFGAGSGDRVRVRSQRLLAAGTALVRVGVPLDALLDALERVRAGLDALALLMVDLVADPIVKGLGLGDGSPPTGEHLRAAAEQIRLLRHEAEVVVQLELTRALEHRTRERVAELVGRALEPVKPEMPIRR